MTTGEYSLKEYAASRKTPKEIRDVLAEMHNDGWTAKPRNKRGFWAVPPDGKVRPYYVPITVKDVTMVARDIARAHRHWRDLQVQVGIAQAEIRQTLEENARSGPGPIPYCGVHDQVFMSWEVLSEHVRTTHDSTDPDPTLDQPEEEPVQDEPPAEVSSGVESCTIDEGDGSPDVTEKVDKNTSRKGNPHAKHNDWQQVRGELARDIYQAMRGRSQANMALSTYANALAMDIEARRLEEGRTAFDDGSTLLQLIQSLVNQVNAENSELESALRTNEDLAREMGLAEAEASEWRSKYESLKAKWDAVMSLAKEE